MSAILWIVRVLIFLLVLRLLLRWLSGLRLQQRSAAGSPRARTTERLGGELVRDPQCGTFVPKARAVVDDAGRETRYFCSTTCRDAFAARKSA